MNPRSYLVGASQGVHLDSGDAAHPVMPGPLQRGEAAECLFQLDQVDHAIVEHHPVGASVPFGEFEGQSAALAALAVKAIFEA